MRFLRALLSSCYGSKIFMLSKYCKLYRVLCKVPRSTGLFSSIKRNVSSTSVGILGAPLSKGQSKHGVDLGPDFLRNFGLVKQLQDLGLDVKDYGNVEVESNVIDRSYDGKLIYPLEVGAACHKISEAVQKVLQHGKKCVTLGGDHSLGMGTVHGHAQVHDTCVLWIDAHPDINTPITSYTGHLHGMPLSFLIKELEKYQTPCQGFEWLKPCISKRNVAFIGLRDIDPLEKLILMKEDILHFTMRDIDRIGIFEVIWRALKGINPSGELSLHVSMDIDSIDTMVTPCTGTPVLGGLTVREVLCIAEEVTNLDNFRALDIVEVNPKLGNKEQLENTLDVAVLITKAFLGYSRNGKVPSNIHEIPVA